MYIFAVIKLRINPFYVKRRRNITKYYISLYKFNPTQIMTERKANYSFKDFVLL